MYNVTARFVYHRSSPVSPQVLVLRFVAPCAVLQRGDDRARAIFAMPIIAECPAAREESVDLSHVEHLE